MQDFTRGSFKKLKANSVIHLGRLERNIYAGDIVEFDGFSLKFGGQVTEMPELKAGVKRGWLSIVGNDTVEPVKMGAPATPPKKEMPVQSVYDEERPVAEVSSKKVKEKKKFPLVVESQDDDIIQVSKVKNTSGAEISGASSASDGVSEMQEAKSVSSIKLATSSKQRTVISDGSQASEEISKLDNIEAPVSPTKIASKNPAPLQSDSVETEDEVEVSLTLSQEQALENTQILQAIDGEVKAEQGALAVGKDDSKIKHLPNGVEWDTSKHWSKRAKIALEMYGDQPEVLDEIIKVETKGVKTAIEKGRN